MAIPKKNFPTYKLLRAEYDSGSVIPDCSEFDKILNYYLSCGWEIHGELKIITNEDLTRQVFFQSVVNRTDMPDHILEFVSALKNHGFTIEDIEYELKYELDDEEFNEHVLNYATNNPNQWEDEKYSTTIEIKGKKITLKHPLFYKEPEEENEDDLALGGGDDYYWGAY